MKSAGPSFRTRFSLDLPQRRMTAPAALLLGFGDVLRQIGQREHTVTAFNAGLTRAVLQMACNDLPTRNLACRLSTFRPKYCNSLCSATTESVWVRRKCGSCDGLPITSLPRLELDARFCRERCGRQCPSSHSSCGKCSCITSANCTLRQLLSGSCDCLPCLPPRCSSTQAARSISRRSHSCDEEVETRIWHPSRRNLTF